MASGTAPAPDVFSAREIARAAGVPVREVRSLFASRQIRSLAGRFASTPDAVRTVRRLRGGNATFPAEPRELFRPHAPSERAPGRALAASSLVHAVLLGILALATTWSVAGRAEEPRLSAARLVFLATPGPGGGGGGGGLRQPAPAPRAKLKGTSALRSPVPAPRRILARRPEPRARIQPPPPARPTPVRRPVEPPPAPPQVEPLPQVVAPVATVAADDRDRAGIFESASDAPGHGAGAGGGAGTGRGTGIGEGDGAGIGPGSGGGTGGGPYRPGSGITPPSLLREVKPDYTEDARRRGVEGDVVLEIVVGSDGSVGSIRLLQGLGGGLDQRAIDAVRQWRFAPARRHGLPVDVLVEVAVEFKLR